MRTFRLAPARPGSHWGLARNSGEVLVRACTSGEARAVAAAEEAAGLRGPGSSFNPAASAFRDPKLYAVRLVDETEKGMPR
jgi:hypothetical protein